MDDRVVYWNKSAERMYGWRAEEVIGKRTTETYFETVPAEFEAQRVLLERAVSRRVHHVTKDERVCWWIVVDAGA